MKKYISLLFILSCFAYSSCSSYSYDLEKMGDAVKQHLRYRDADNNTVTKIDYLKAVSYEKIAEDKRMNPDEEYLCRVYVKGVWSYAGSYRMFNIDDTLNCYFTDKKTFLRIEDLKER